MGGRAGDVAAPGAPMSAAKRKTERPKMATSAALRPRPTAQLLEAGRRFGARAPNSSSIAKNPLSPPSTNRCLNLLRARKALWREQLRAAQADRRQETEGPDRRELVRVLLAAAPEEAQEVAVLYFVDELTQAEIALEVGRSLPTVRKRLREFLACAREALGVELEGADL